MNKEIYKIIPFSEVVIGQKFEDARLFCDITKDTWVKLEGGRAFFGSWMDCAWEYDAPCLVRIADCKQVSTKLLENENKMNKEEDYIKRLSALKTCDTEVSHRDADLILCEILAKLGYEEVVAAWDELDKWYS